MVRLSDGFKGIYKSFVENNKEISKEKCLPLAGWGNAKKIKKLGNDTDIVNRLYDGIVDNQISAKELRWFTPEQLTALKNKVISESKGDTQKTKLFEEVFAKTVVIAHKRNHSETKQKSLYEAYNAIKKADGAVERSKSQYQKAPEQPQKPPVPTAPKPVKKTAEQENVTQEAVKQEAAPQERRAAFKKALEQITGQPRPQPQPKKREIVAQSPAKQAVTTNKDAANAADKTIAAGKVPDAPLPPPTNLPKVKKKWATVEAEGDTSKPKPQKAADRPAGLDALQQELAKKLHNKKKAE